MADTKISDLSAATTPIAGTEVVPLVQGGATVKLALTPANIGAATAAQGGLADTAVQPDTAISALSLSLTGNISSPAWTTNGLKLKSTAATLTDTSSSGTVAAANTNKLGGNTIAASSPVTFTNYSSLTIAPPVAGTNATLTNKYSLTLDGALSIPASPIVHGDSTTIPVLTSIAAGTAASYGLFYNDAGYILKRNGQFPSKLGPSGLLLKLATTVTYGVHWVTDSETSINFNTFATSLTSPAAGIIEQRVGTAAQAHRVFNTWTDASNGEWGCLDWKTTSNTLIIGAKAQGSGTLRKIQLVGAGVLTDATILPTSNPTVAGQLWNDGGTVKVSAG